jgi:hypothetical protein
MIEIDLLKYFDKSFSEIDELLHNKIETQEDFNEKDELTTVIDKGKRKSALLKYLVFSVLIIVISFSGFKFYQLIKSNLKTIPQQESKITTETNIIKSDESLQQKSENVDTKSKTDNNDVIVLGTIELLGENLPPLSTDNLSKEKDRQIPTKPTKNQNIEIPNREHKNLESNAEKENKETPEKRVNKNFYIKLYYIDTQALENIKNKLKSYSKKELKILGKNTKNIAQWYLYKPTKGTNYFIGNREVALIKTFNNKNEAIRFAKDNHIPAIIVKKSKNEISYDLIITGFDSKSEANEFIKPFKINKNKIRILEDNK